MDGGCDCALKAYHAEESIEGKLRRLKARGESRPDSWNSLHDCPECGAVWELTYPEHCGQCGGAEPVLMRISPGKTAPA